MTYVKRLEIVTGAQEFDRVVKVLEAFGITGYVVVREIEGQGDRRLGAVDVLTGSGGSRLILTTCPPEQMDALARVLEPLLALYGGACVAYDAQCLVAYREPVGTAR